MIAGNRITPSFSETGNGVVPELNFEFPGTQAPANAAALKSHMRFLVFPLLALAAYGADYKLKATPATVAWGYYWSAAKPVLKIQSGDTVEIQTMLTNSPDRLASAGVKAEEIESELKARFMPK